MKDAKGPQDDNISKLIEYMEQHKNEMRTIEEYSSIVGFSNPRRLHASLSQHHHKHGIVKVTKVGKDRNKYFYGVSDQCDGRQPCYYTWCKGYKVSEEKLACPLGQPNPELKFFEL